MNTDESAVQQLLAIMRRLRHPETGCDWDIQQNFRTIAPFTVEEAYEVADAIERNDLDDLCDELGDLLFQVVFHSQMATELGAFTFDDVAQSIVNKMIRRHPHVFGDVVYESEAALKAGWEAIKVEERRLKLARRQAVALQDGERPQEAATPFHSDSQRNAADNFKSGSASAATSNASAGSGSHTVGESPAMASEPFQSSALDGIARGLPALKRADKLQKRCVRVGFDWPDIDPVWHKLDEEISEVRDALVTGDHDAIEDEIGDLLFTVVNLARHCSVDSEQALQRANGKFEARFRRVERLAAGEATTLQSMSLAQLDDLWDKAKLADSTSTS